MFISVCDVCNQVNDGRNARMSTFGLSSAKKQMAPDILLEISVDFAEHGLGGNIHHACLIDVLSDLLRHERKLLRQAKIKK